MSPTEPETPHEPLPVDHGWHPVNVGHLVMGVAFLGLTIVWALVISDTLTMEDHRWLFPAPWIAAGVAGLIASGARKSPRN